MNTKERIMDEALTLFSQKGYGDVYVGEIADAVGIGKYVSDTNQQKTKIVNWE